MESRRDFLVLVSLTVFVLAFLTFMFIPFILGVVLVPVQGTRYPVLVVKAGSMVPTLNWGDLIIIQGGLNVSDIVAEYGTGDIVVFHQPTRPSELIVHRAVERLQDADGWYLKTKGDYNSSPDNWKVYDDDFEGKVVMIIPFWGYTRLFQDMLAGTVVLTMLVVAAVVCCILTARAYTKMKAERSTSESW